ncbi:hypothetical protein [Qipengyuania sp. JC766]|uniref:hypothetical protein n=1 Tax=Qipengyuania sp. JC766 TaxID=3232139 RepID=UPI003457ABE1
MLLLVLFALFVAGILNAGSYAYSTVAVMVIFAIPAFLKLGATNSREADNG